MAAPIYTEEKVRLFLSDKPELNPLLGGVRFTAEQIEEAGILAIDYFNSSSPPTGSSYTIENFPYAYILLTGICGLLLRGGAINQASNQLTYQASDVAVNDYDKAELFTKLGTEFWNEFKDMTKQVKINQNMANAYGTKFSEYIYRAR